MSRLWSGTGVGILMLMCLANFLQMDTTNEHPYIYPDYVCKDFARDFKNNASAFGLDINYVHVWNNTFHHLLVAYHITPEKRAKYGLVDKEYIFIEPQIDWVFMDIPYEGVRVNII